MKQIKTIAAKVGEANEFDDLVNAAIADGWTLTRRLVVQGCENTYTALVAELEREVEA